MFLSEFNDEQKIAFLSLAKMVALADGHLAIEESTLIDIFRSEMGLSDATVRQMDVPAAAVHFDTRKAKVCALLELIGLGYAHGDFNKDELEVVHDINKEFGLSSADFDLMMNWVLRQMELMDDAFNLMK